MPQPLDFCGVDQLLSQEERQVQELVGRFVDQRVRPIIGECFEKERFPRELISEVAKLGLLGPTIHGYGCAGLNNICYGVAMQELERGDSGLRSFCSVQSSLVMYPIFTYGTDEQKNRWLPKMAKGEAIGCFGLTEPAGGSDPGQMQTKAVRDGNSWVLNGAKMWITNGGIADVAVVWANTPEGINGFLVERDFAGFVTNDIHHKFSLRASVTSELVFEECRVPETNRLPKASGLGAPLSCLTQARYGIAWGVIGAALACLDEALQFTKTRKLFGSTLDQKQAVQIRLADMVRQISLAQLLNVQLGRLKDAGKLHYAQVCMAKWNNCRTALDVARECRDLLGAGGISVECSPIRHALNLESVITYEGTETIHQLIVGREITGKEAF